jgi:hypothetical protein
MHFHTATRPFICVSMILTLSACGGNSIFNAPAPTQERAVAQRTQYEAGQEVLARSFEDNSGVPDTNSTIWDLFSNESNPNVNVEVNKYLWNASLDILNFLPIQSVDPFTGVIVTGFGTPPGGGRSYRATIYVQDPALDARSLKVALVGSNGQAVAPETARAVEDAIMTRARELRIQDSNL